MKAPQGSKAVHRNGQSGVMEAPDDNGFALFHSDTGACYTVHQLEVTHEDLTAKEMSERPSLWASWPSGTLRFAIEQGERVASKAFIVARTAPGFIGVQS